MTDDFDFIDEDFSFDDEPDESDEIGQTTHFAELQFYRFPVNPFAKGGTYEPFTLPGVYNDEYDFDTKASTRVGLKEFKRARVSKSKSALNILVIKKYNVDGDEYQIIKQWCNWPDKREVVTDLTGQEVKPPNWWKEHQFLAFRDAQGDRGALAKSGQVALKKGPDAPGAWVYAQYEQVSTGLRVHKEIFGEEREWEVTIVGNIVLYPSKEEWEKAKIERFGDNGVTLSTSWHEGLELPEAWQSNPDALKSLISDKREEGSEKIIDFLTLGENGEAIIKAALKDNPF